MRSVKRRYFSARVRVPVGFDLGAVLVDQHRLHVAERVQAVLALVAAEAALLDAAEGQGRVGLGGHDVVDRHAADREGAATRVARVEILAPDAGGQAVLESLARRDRPPSSLVERQQRDAAGRRSPRARSACRRVTPSTTIGGIRRDVPSHSAPVRKRGALRLGVGDLLGDDLHLEVGGHRAEVGVAVAVDCLLQRVAPGAPARRGRRRRSARCT